MAPRFALVMLSAVFAALLWTGVPKLGNVTFVWDNTEFARYAQTFDETGHIPPKSDNYEFSLPPGQPALAVGIERVARWVGPVDGRPAGSLPRSVRTILWLALVAAATWLLLTGRRRIGVLVAGAALVLAALDVLSAATNTQWVAVLLPDIASIALLPLISAALARELWPSWRWAPTLAAFATMLFPVVFRIGLVFHPDPVFAALVCGALLVTLRAHRRGWTTRSALWNGVLLAAAAWTRQSAVEVMLAIGLIVLVLGRRTALRYLAVVGVTIALLAGPWWGYQTSKYGNPIQANLNRPGIMLSHEPASFFFEVPGAVVTNPWSVLNHNDLFPKFHVGLWSDWTGIGDFGPPKTRDQKALASSQSVLGFGGDLLVLGGLFVLGVPAAVRAIRRGAEDDEQAGLAAMSIFFLVAWAAYLATLLRFPQRDADPNSPHYLVFLAPAAALLGLAAARRLWSSGGTRRLAAVAWTAVYTASWIWVLTIVV